MTVQKLPFTISKRKTSRYYYVRFKNGKTGGYSTAVSTRQTDREEAIRTAWSWYAQGKTTAGGKERSLESREAWEEIRRSGILDDDADKILDYLKKTGKIRSYVKAGEKNDIPLACYLMDFWTWEKSEYVQEKTRHGKTIGRAHVKKNWYIISKYWKPYFKDMLLGELTRQDLRGFLSYLQGKDISGATKNQVWLAGAQAIRYAYNNELIERDITAGLIGFSEKPRERKILTPELAEAVFSVEWTDSRAYLANLLAMCTGLRSGEIRALRKQDLGRDCLYIRHSWSRTDGLKSTKNGEARVVQLPFTPVASKLMELAESNPFTSGMEAFVFYATVPGQPIEGDVFRDGLRNALESIGMKREEAAGYCFHSWRHFYASYMKDRISEKLLQSQTGHKTLSMLEHYADHRISGDDEQVQRAQIDVFGGIIGKAHLDALDRKRLYNNIRTECMDKAGLYEHSRQDR